MSAVPVAPDTAVQLLAELHGLVREAAQLGAKFRLSGADVTVGNAGELPGALRERIVDFADSGWLFAYLGGERLDQPAIDLGARLGIEVVVVTTAGELHNAIRHIESDKSRHGGIVGIDVETAPKPGCGAPRPAINLNIDGSVAERQPEPKDRSALSPHLADIQCLQLYAGGTQCFLLRGEAVRTVLRSHWLRRQHLVIHNAVFETAFIAHGAKGYRPPAGRRSRGRVECTMQGAGLLLGTEHSALGGRSLANAAARILDVEVPKDLQRSDWAAPKLSPGQLAYAASDAILAWRLWPEIERQLTAKKRIGAYELQRRAVPAVADMQLRGLLLDKDEHHRQTEVWAHELAASRQQYVELTGNPPPSTPAEVRSWLQRVLPEDRLASWPRTATGELSIAQTFLKRLVDIDSAKPVLVILARQKLLQNFGPKLSGLINLVTGRLHCDFNLAAAKSGRFSASTPNLQQLPNSRAPEFKRCVVAAPGNLLVGPDWSQIELRGAAWLAQDMALTRVYAEGRDLHVETAASIAGVPAEVVTAGQRQAAKPVNFGAIYGIGPATLRADAFANYGVEMSELEAARALDRFLSAYTQLARWREINADICQARGYVEIGVGRVVEAGWEYSGRLSFPQCCNLPIQGICADAMLRALTLTHRRLKLAGIRGGIIASIHDELLLEVAEGDAEPARLILEESMLAAFSETFPGAPANGVAAAKIGRSWAEVK
jgi:DNA polymerase-1